MLSFRDRPRQRLAHLEQLEPRCLLSTVYQVIDLGTLGGSTSMAMAINNAGQVVGEADTAAGVNDAFLYDPATGHMQDLGTLGSHVGSATSINSQGQIVGWSVATDGRAHPFLYSGGQLSDLMPPGGVRGEANSIDDTGMIALTADAPNGSQHAYRRNGTSFTDIGAQLSAGSNSFGQAINAAGQVAGQITGGSAPNGWFLYDGSTARELGAPAGTDASLPFRVTSMNDAGQIIGYRLNQPTDITQPNLPSGWMFANGGFTPTAIAQPQFIDNAGHILGTSPIADQSGKFVYHAFLTAPDGTTQDLNNLIAAGFGQGWVLWQANGMNAKGEIAGWGVHDGVPHAFLLEPVEGPPPAAQGQITGTVFNDSNSDGRNDAGEQGLGGWQVYVDSNNNAALDAGEPVTTTDPAGNYVLSGLLAGTYRVREVQPGGWTATVPAPSGSDGVFYDAIVATNTSTVSGDDFGNAPIQVSTGSGAIQGILFNDANGNGTRQKKEKPLAGWQVFADVNNDGLLEAGEPAATSDAAGNYAITGLGAGVYHVREVLQPGWIITTPAAGSFDATLATDNRIISAPPFGNVLAARITGSVFNDATGKGHVTRGMSGLANWRVFLDVNGDGTWQPDEPNTTTNTAGQYTLTSLRAGRYMLRVQPQAAWQQTRPAKGAGLRVKLSWKKTLKAQPFGEHQIG